ncbi:dipeptidylpeptidase [Haplosporangium sp. Z 767]|nr:dipeptidylpeptidase [Haplosporangium sp. Z 767]KAF9196201.1 dipeptidylpeptidase [Haplosporangium sp. Z 11]
MASWDQIRNEVRSFRASVQPTVTTIRDFTFDSHRDRIYFLANDLSKSSKSPMLFRVDLPPNFSTMGSDLDSGTDTDTDQCDTNQEDQEQDLDMGLVPFNPDTFQFIAGPSPPIQITPGTREPSCAQQLLYPSQTPEPPATPETSMTAQILAAAPVLTWTPVLTEPWLKHAHSSMGHSQGDRLSFYQFEPQGNLLLFPYGTAIYTGQVQEDGNVNPQPVQANYPAAEPSMNTSYTSMVHNALTAGLNMVSVSGPLTSPRASFSSATGANLDKGAGSLGTKADPRLGGSGMDLISFTRDQDIWVMTTSGVETQLTFCSRNKKKSNISCGIAEFVMQEEFHRFTNYYWAPPALSISTSGQPQRSPSIHTVSSSSQSTQSTSQQQTMPSSVSSPSPSAQSPSSTFSSPSFSGISPASLSSKLDSRTPVERIIYLQVSEAMVDLVVIPRHGVQLEYEEYRYPRAGTPNAVSDLQIVEFIPKRHEEDVVPEPLHKRLWGKASLYKMFPWVEYIVRFGWLSDGESVWVQILDRRQQITAIVMIPLACFMSVAEQAESTDKTEEDLASLIRVIYEEQSDYWINVTDIMYIFPQEHQPTLDHMHADDAKDTIQFIVPSERTGYRHLYLAAHSTRFGSTIVPITEGQYQIVDKPITVDPVRQLVYFVAKRDSVLEAHLYVASYATGAQPGNVKRLTELGYSHQTTVDVEKNRFLTMYSSVDQSPACAVFYLRWGDCKSGGPSISPAEYGGKPAWCPCGCRFPKVSSHAYVIKEGIRNLTAKEIKRFPIVFSDSHSSHGRSFSDPSMGTSRMDTTFGGFRTGSMNSISGFLASHLLSANLLPSPKSLGRSHDSSMVLSSSSGAATHKPSFKFVPTVHPSASSSPSTTPSFASVSGAVNASHHPVGEFFTFMSSDNVELHGCLYRPANYVQGQKYPTLVSIYGGPRSQMVSNEYKLPKFLRVFLATRLGHAVVMIDGRGSNDRGLNFEGHLRHQMGQIEIRDQVEGLQFLAQPENGGLVDMDRVAISGWSYGKCGYLSLMAIAQYPHIFKIAIAGAPVTQWELYNSAYTERYMGLVNENKDGYVKSNVLSWIDKFPDSENRLLIAHGLIDENVHFKNTETLAAELVRFNKPHQIQLYPTERHGLRDARVNEHFETLMFFWLKNYL